MKLQKIPKKVLPEARFESLGDHTPLLMDRVAKLAEELRGHPIESESGGIDWFLYWSKEHLARQSVCKEKTALLFNHNYALRHFRAG